MVHKLSVMQQVRAVRIVLDGEILEQSGHKMVSAVTHDWVQCSQKHKQKQRPWKQDQGTSTASQLRLIKPACIKPVPALSQPQARALSQPLSQP